MFKTKILSKLYPKTHTVFAFVVAFVLMLLCILAFMQRSFGGNQINKEILKIQESLLNAGWDMAYDEAETSSFPLFAPVKFSNFRIYSLDGSKEWKTEELEIDMSLFNPGHIELKTDRFQTITFGGKIYPAEIPVLNINLDFDQSLGLRSINIEGTGWNIQDLITVDSFRLAAQRMAPLNISELTPFFENHVEIKGAKISEYVDFPLRKKINKIYAHTNIIGKMNEKPTYNETIKAWLRLGGVVDIKKLIVEWAPLTMVAQGDLYFNEKLEPVLHLNTSSKGLEETMDMLQDNFLERKGVFVAKILLNNKSFKLNPEDKYYTVTTPININSNQILIENIPLKTF